MTLGPPRWLMLSPPRPMAKARVLAFPYAGAGPSSYGRWGSLMPSQVELMIAAPPGREHRSAEPSVVTMAEYVSSIVEEMPQDRLPVVLFGHSLGAIVAFEVALRLSTGGRPPAALFISGRGYPSDLPTKRPIHALPDAELLRVVRQRYDAPPVELDDHPDLLAEAMASLRADLALLERFDPRLSEREPLGIPVTIYHGREDPGHDAAATSAWHAVTTGPVSYREYPGAHLFVREHAADIVADLAEAALSAPHPSG